VLRWVGMGMALGLLAMVVVLALVARIVPPP
jgi:hypothetical protein